MLAQYYGQNNVRIFEFQGGADYAFFQMETSRIEF
jgi:hypothetical protein|tara:strand:+ start:4085 stop:4189 length:105 start_codon:yes stop_codon:yes gene_type:complete